MKVLFCFLGLSMSSSLFAAPVQWTVASGGNGHWYEVVNQPRLWDDAVAYAASHPYNGMPGYLVSITSAAEKDFLVSQFGGVQMYGIGLTDRVQEGVWRWQSGEPYLFTFWATGEPNNAGAGEDYAAMNWQHAVQPQPQPPGSWNDLPNLANPYIFEYGAPVPEPATWLSLAAGIALISIGRRLRATL